MHGECRVTSLTRPWLYTYTWDEAGRLKTVSKNGTLLATYAYDHHNRRSRKSTTAAAPQGAQTILYHYDQDDHLIAETRSDGTPLRTYVWLAERPLTVIEHAALANPPRSLHLQHDHLGTPRLARNDAGVIQWRWDSDGYGTTTPTHDPDGDGKATVINLRFPGQYYDQESGLYYNWNRYYSPRLGRYLSADPIGIEGGANGYGYVAGNPLSRIDPEGLAGSGQTTQIPGGNPTTVRIDPPHVPGQQSHAHVCEKGCKEIVVNQDGTKSHNSRGDPSKLKNRVKNYLRGKGFKLMWCPPFLEDLVMGMAARQCAAGDLTSCQIFQDMGGTIQDGSEI